MMLTIFGACAVTFMMMMYAFERRHPRFILAFACGCVLSSTYGFLAGTWPFGVVEAIWAVIALRRYVQVSRDARLRSEDVRGPAIIPADPDQHRSLQPR